MIKAIRPQLKLLSDELIQKIMNEAYEVLEKKGVWVENEEALSLLSDAGAKIEKKSLLRGFLLNLNWSKAAWSQLLQL